MDLGQILIGGSVTLAGTVLVQLVVVPRAQARTRGRERWEKDVMSLAALLEEELPRALSGHRSAGYRIWYIRQLEGAEGYNPGAVDDLLQGAETEMRVANQVVGEHMARIRVLIARAKRLQRDAPLWSDIDNAWMSLRVAMFAFDHPRPEGEDLSDEQWDSGWERVGKARDRLVAMVDMVAGAYPMKPPRRPPLRQRIQAGAREGGIVGSCSIRLSRATFTSRLAAMECQPYSSEVQQPQPPDQTYNDREKPSHLASDRQQPRCR